MYFLLRSFFHEAQLLERESSKGSTVARIKLKEVKIPPSIFELIKWHTPCLKMNSFCMFSACGQAIGHQSLPASGNLCFGSCMNAADHCFLWGSPVLTFKLITSAHLAKWYLAPYSNLVMMTCLLDGSIMKLIACIIITPLTVGECELGSCGTGLRCGHGASGWSWRGMVSVCGVTHITAWGTCIGDMRGQSLITTLVILGPTYAWVNIVDFSFIIAALKCTKLRPKCWMIGAITWLNLVGLTF